MEAAIPLVFILIWVVMIGIGIALVVFWIVAIIDVIQREFPGENDKLIWVLVVVLAGWIGALIYWFAGRDKGVRRA